jgi:carnosine N-methyltransferase
LNLSCKKENEFKIYPWINQWTNNLSISDQLREVKFPDLKPFELPYNSEFSMGAGSFLEIYNDKGMLLLNKIKF